MSVRPQVVIIGAGFGGLWAAKAVACEEVDLHVIDRNNFHTFFPLLYQVAAAELEPEDIAYPIRSIIRQLPRTRFSLAEVRHVDVDSRTVTTDRMSVPYDYLIMGMGSVSFFFHVPGAEEFSYPLKTMDQAVELRNQILCCFERATQERDPDVRRRLLTFAIVGGGPTGVEFAGALSELVRGPLKKDFRGIDFREVQILVLESSKGLLAGFPDQLKAYAAEQLTCRGAVVRLGTPVTEVLRHGVRLADGTHIETETVIWTAGVRGTPLPGAWGIPTTRNGTVPVESTLQLAGHPTVYVIGDGAIVDQQGKPLPMLAPVAIQQGTHAGKSILRQIGHKEVVPFRYKDRGTMATIGRNSAVAELAGVTFTGFPAWVLWLSVHIFKLIGFRNRLLVMINWAWDYLFFERAIRMILPGAVPAAEPPASMQQAGQLTERRESLPAQKDRATHS